MYVCTQVSSLYRDPILEDQIDLSIVSVILEMPGVSIIDTDII